MCKPVYHVEGGLIDPLGFLGDIGFIGWEGSGMAAFMFDIACDGPWVEVQDALPCWELVNCLVVYVGMVLDESIRIVICIAIELG